MGSSSFAGKRVAFFGGSFDPPHQGHLAVARAARSALGLDEVLFAPVGTQPLKPNGWTASFEARVEMTRLAIQGEKGFDVSLVDAPKASAAPNYTIDTLLQLRAGLPPDGELFCLMGADSFLNLQHWYRAEEIPFVASLIVASRPGQSLDGLRAALPTGLALADNTAVVDSSHGTGYASFEVATYRLVSPAGDLALLHVLRGLHVDVSASQVRQQIHRDGGRIAGTERPLLSPDVLKYIQEHRLYR